MNRQKIREILVKVMTLTCFVSVLFLKSPGPVMGEENCTKAVGEYEKKLEKLMQGNRKSLKMMKEIMGVMSISAKRIAAADKDVNKFMKDGQISKKEATKLSKMSLKRDVLEEGARKLKMISKAMLKYSWAVSDARREMERVCQSQ